MSAEQLLLTALASALGTLFAAAVGLRFALARFRKERAFDRRLSWYEGAARSLIDAANKINWALAAEAAERPTSELTQAWSNAYDAVLKLRGLEAEAELYATNRGYRAVSDAVGHVTAMARAVFALAKDPKANSPVTPTRIFDITYRLLFHAASALAEEVRDHLDLDEIQREWRIYDREYQDLLDELNAWKAKGVDWSDGAWASRPTSERETPAVGEA